MRRFAITALVLGFALLGSASAANLYRGAMPRDTAITIAAGDIGGDGKVLKGSGFIVSHEVSGLYQISFEQSYFQPSGCASLVVESTDVDTTEISNVVQVACAPRPTFLVRWETAPGVYHDRNFHFIAQAE